MGRILITGASGLVGNALVQALKGSEHEILRLVRREPRGPDELGWDPEAGRLAAEALAGAEALVHLAGENIATGRWTRVKKERIRRSRVLGTRTVTRAFLACSRPPPTLLAASAVGFYGDRGDEELDEGSPPGTGFLAETCRAWEAETLPLEEAGIRVARMRIGMVLSLRGGALPRLLGPFKLGLGGRIGSGRQWMSWIGLEDLSRAILFCLKEKALRGPVNLTAPQPVRNAAFARVLASALGRPACLPLPAPAARLLLGEMADELLLASTRALPRRLLDEGFRFRDEDLEACLSRLLPRRL